MLGLEKLTIFSPSSFRVCNALTESIFSDVTWWRKRGPAPLLMGSNPEKNKHYLIIFSSIHILIHQIYIWYMSMTIIFFDMCFFLNIIKLSILIHSYPWWSYFFLVPPCWPDPLRSMSEVDEEPMPISRHTGLCVIWADLPRSSWCLLHHQRCLFPLVPLRWLNMRIWYRKH